jgi:low affinity Fe/Cu permease
VERAQANTDIFAIRAKLDALLRADEKARSELTTLGEKEPETIARHRDAEVRALSRTP